MPRSSQLRRSTSLAAGYHRHVKKASLGVDGRHADGETTQMEGGSAIESALEEEAAEGATVGAL
jgi:hypothetical protein